MEERRHDGREMEGMRGVQRGRVRNRTVDVVSYDVKGVNLVRRIYRLTVRAKRTRWSTVSSSSSQRFPAGSWG